MGLPLWLFVVLGCIAPMQIDASKVGRRYLEAARRRMNTCPEQCNTCHGGKWKYGEWQPGERTWCFDWCSKQGWCGNTRTHIYGMAHDKGFGTDCRGCANLDSGTWVLGSENKGKQSCNDICQERGELCNSKSIEEQTKLRNEKIIKSAMLKAGHTCTEVNGPRNYPGVPFLGPKSHSSNGTCVYFGEQEGVAKYCKSKHCESSCTANQVSGHRPLCNCQTCVNTRDNVPEATSCAKSVNGYVVWAYFIPKWVQKACQDYKESKDCDVECGLCDCSTGTGTYPEHCSGHGRCLADCTLKIMKNNKCYQARCECYPGWKGKKCEIPNPATGRPVLTTLAGTSCQDQNLREITDWSKCLHASRSLGLPWGNGFVTHNTKDGKVGDNEAGKEYDFAACRFSKNGRNPSSTPVKSDFAAICDTIPGNEQLYRSVRSNEIPDYSTDCHTIPSNTKYLVLVMGSAIDYFRPIQGKTYCEMLQNYNLHQWSRDTSNWITPTFYSGHGKLNRRGGSSHRFPQTWQDTRTYVSFWGSTEGSSTKGGCCHSHVGYDDNGNMKTDKSGWGKPFSLYYVDGTQTEEKPLTVSHLPGKFLKVERV